MKDIKDNLKVIRDNSKSGYIQITHAIGATPNIYEIEPGTKVIDFLLKEYPDGFPVKPKCYFNNKEIEVNDFDRTIRKGDVVSIFLLPEGGFVFSIIISVAISFVASYVLSLLTTPEMKNSSGVDNNYESVYSTNVSQIQAKKNGTIPSVYGITRTFPNRICPIYKRYEDNEEHIYLTTAIGIGQYDILQAFIEDSKIEDVVNSHSDTQEEEIDPFSEAYDSDVPFTANMEGSFIPSKNSNFGVISYVKISSEDEDIDYSKVGQELLEDNNYRHIVRTISEISNVSLKESYQEVGFYSINETTEDIDKIEIDFNYSAGLYRTTSDGNFASTTQELLIYIYGYNEAGNPTYKNTKVIQHTGNSKKVYRFTESIDVPPGKYKIKIKRNSVTDSDQTKVSNAPTIIGIKGYEIPKKVNYGDFTTVIFKIKSNEDLSTKNALSLNLLTRRKIGNKHLLSLRDFVTDIWTNSVYGLGEDIAKLDIRAELDENCNVILDSSRNGFETLSEVLKGFGYLFYPIQSQFTIEKDDRRFIRSYIFNETNSKNFSLTWSIPVNAEIGDGVLIKYLEQGALNFSEIKHPVDCDYPSETTLMGVATEELAKNQAYYLYQKKHKRGRSASLETELEGYIPELNSLVGLSRRIMNRTYSLVAVGSFYEDINGEYKCAIKLSDEIDLNSEDYVVQFYYKNGQSSDLFETTISDSGFQDVIYLDSFVELEEPTNMSIGKAETFVEDFIVESIESASEDNKIKLNLVEYNEEVYNGPTT